MIKTWVAEILALALLFSSITALEGSEDRFSIAGNQIVQKVDSSYQGGEYDTFLSQMHTHFQNAGKAGALRGIFESAKVSMKSTQEQRLTKYKSHRNQIAKLDKERNKRLLDAISKNPELEIVQKIDTVVFSSPAPEQSDILAELEALKFHVPETSKATIDNKISALETEYYIKSLLLDVGSHRSKTDQSQINEKKIALQLQKLDKMEEAANELGEKKWVEKIQKAKVAFRAERAFRIDYQALQNLAYGNIDPQNPVEEMVKEIIMDYQQQKENSFAEIAQNS